MEVLLHQEMWKSQSKTSWEPHCTLHYVEVKKVIFTIPDQKSEQNNYYYQKSRQTVFYSWLTIQIIFVHIRQYWKPVKRFSCFSDNSVACITCSRLFSRFLLAHSFLGLIWQLQAEAGWWVSERGGGRRVEIWTQLWVLLLILCLRTPPVWSSFWPSCWYMTIITAHTPNLSTDYLHHSTNVYTFTRDFALQSSAQPPWVF